jgi:alpha-beta hydrolase superfamily lysophospholipase
VNAPRPADIGRHEGLAYSLWLPAGEPRAGVVILHGAGSCKESHHDYARVLIADGFAALAFDQRGHGDSDRPMDGRALEDVGSMAALLRAGSGSPELPLALRGTSLGGCLAILAASVVGASAVVAICPASPEGLRRGLRAGRLSFEADVGALDALLGSLDLDAAVEGLDVPLLLMHAAGDERVPVEHSRELAKLMRVEASRLIVVPGGHHRSVQHDPELQAVTVRFLQKALGLLAG